jgi:hypothetical protein
MQKLVVVMQKDCSAITMSSSFIFWIIIKLQLKKSLMSDDLKFHLSLAKLLTKEMTWKSVVFFVYTDVTNKDIYSVVKKTTITETVRLNRLRWFWHVQRIEESKIPKKSIIYEFGNNEAER